MVMILGLRPMYCKEISPQNKASNGTRMQYLHDAPRLQDWAPVRQQALLAIALYWKCLDKSLCYLKGPPIDEEFNYQQTGM